MSRPDPTSSAGIRPSGYRLPEPSRLGRVRLQVTDLDRSLAFYERVLGLRAVDQFQARALLGTREEETILVELIENPAAEPVPRRGRLGLFHVAFRLPERAALGRFVRHLSGMGLEPGMSDHLVSEAVYLSDPDGLGIEVYADRPRDHWRYDADGQIEMATKPLDARSLADAAGETAWADAPAGTVVGHVHLHVGDLDRAASFYHEALGFDKTVWGYPGALFFSAGGYHHHLGTNVWAGDVPPAGEDDARLLEWTLLLPTAEDVSAAARSLESAGYFVTRDASACRTADPWGTSLRIAPES